MTNIDQFESTFRAAAKERFEYAPVAIKQVLVVTDKDAAGTEAVVAQAQAALPALARDEQVQWEPVVGEQAWSAIALLELVEKGNPDLVCTYRNLHSEAWRYPYSLGEHLDVLTQHSTVPIFVLPHPDGDHGFAPGKAEDYEVMAVTDHLLGDDRLVNFAAKFTDAQGALFLAHIEDDVAFGRVMDAIAKIPTINTEQAEESIRAQYLKDAEDYIDSCRRGLEAVGLPIRVEKIVGFGHRVAEYKRYIDQHAVDILVLNTKDKDQLAMDGLAYGLANELRHIPLLML